MSFVVPSENVPVAKNCCSSPAGMLGIAGVTSSAIKVADVIVREALPWTLADVALIVVVPVANDLTSPWEPCALLITAIPLLSELQVTFWVRFWVVLSV
jgi:hypothetical protein